MAISVQIVTDAGKTVDCASDPGLLDKVVDDNEDYRLLGRIDREGEISFGTDHMEELLADLETSSQWAHPRAEQQFIIDVERLARRVSMALGSN